MALKRKTSLAGTGAMRFLPKVGFKKTLVAAVLAFGVAAGSFAGWITYNLPDISQLSTSPAHPSPPPNLTVRVAELPPYLIQALLAAEDREFYHHPGIDLLAVGRAMIVDFRAERPLQGGSTITEQLAKNLLPPQQSEILQKLREMALALKLEHHFTKDRILELYLDRVYFGSGAYGIEAAAQRYFGKSASQVTLYQAAMLIGLLKAPSRLNPMRHAVLADRRARSVLQDMVAAGFLTNEQVQQVLTEKR